MMLFKNILNNCKIDYVANAIVIFLLLIGTLNTFGYVFQSAETRGIAFATTSSPLPFVFSAYNGVETFSLIFDIDIKFKNDSHINLALNNELYNNLSGSYNRRNVYGAIFSYGPFFDDTKMISIRQQVLYNGFCTQKGKLLEEFGDIDNVTISISSKTIGNEDKKWQLSISC